MELERLKLFENRWEFAFFATIVVSLFLFNLYNQFQTYQKLKATNFYHSDAVVQNQYQKVSKRGKVYHVLTLKSDEGFSFITTTYEDIKDLRGRDVRVGLVTKKLDFASFLKRFYAPTYDLELKPYQDSLRQKIKLFIEKQHKDEYLKELFSALFLATPISKELRESISTLGISHLVAISGYHLGFLYALLFAIFGLVYRFFQDRYFPYRNRILDLSIAIFVFLFFYAYLLEFTPSLLRSFVMMVFGFLLYIRHIKVFSFEVLFVVMLLLIALFPRLLFSVGFWFSVSGIFYIYLFLHYFSDLKKWQIAVLINIWVFVLINPIIHYIFPNFEPHQLLSPLLSLLFAIFYPSELLLHIVGQGNLLDSLLLKMLDTQSEFVQIATPFWFLVYYVVISILAIFSRWFLYLLVVSSLGFYLLFIIKSIYLRDI